MICPNCGANLPNTAVLCYSCRTKFDHSTHTYYPPEVGEYFPTNPNMNTDANIHTAELRGNPDPRVNQPAQFNIPQQQNRKVMNQGLAKTQGKKVAPSPAQNTPSASEIASAVVGKIFLWIFLIFVVFPIAIKVVSAIAYSRAAEADVRDAYREESQTYNQTTTEEQTTEDIIKYEETIAFETVFENDEFLIKTTKYKHDSTGIDIGLYIENKSAKNITYAISDIAINEQMFTTWVNGDITSGNKANDYIRISANDLESLIGEKIRCFTIRVAAWDSDDFSDHIIDPFEIKTSFYSEKKEYSKGESVYSDDCIDVLFDGCSGNTYKFILLNKSEDFLMWGLDGITINGFSNSDLNYSISGTVLGGKEQRFELDISSEFKTNNDSVDINLIEFNISGHFGLKYFNDYDTSVISVDINK